MLIRYHGKPTVVGYTARDINTWADLMARSLAAGGAHRGDIIHNAYGYGLFTAVWVCIMALKSWVHP